MARYLSTAGPTLETRRQMAALAEWVAEGGSITAWSRHIGISQSRADQIWRRIVRSLGAQAQ